jgi:hypothetical protein
MPVSIPVHSCLTPAKYQPWTKSGLVWKFKKKTKYKYQADRKISEKIQYQYQQVCSKDDTCPTLVNTILLMLKVPEQHMYLTVSLCCSNHSWVLFLVLFSFFIRVWVSSVSCLLIGCCYCQIWHAKPAVILVVFGWSWHNTCGVSMQSHWYSL